MEALGKLFELIKVPIRYVIGVALVNSFVLFCPNSWVDRIGLLKYREDGKSYLGLSLLVLGAIIISNFAGFLIARSKDYLFLRVRRQRLHALTSEEAQVLRQYIVTQSRTAYLSMQSGVTRGLEHEQIIYRSSNLSSPGAGFASFAYNIQPWAWNYLNEHRDLLGLN